MSIPRSLPVFAAPPASAEEPHNATVLILGQGDLGRRIGIGLAGSPRAARIVLAGRESAASRAHARMLAACTAIPVHSAIVDGLDSAALRLLIERERPALIVQCASLMSPWALHERTDALACALRSAGFALQLPAQLPVVTALMRAVRASGLKCAVVNCSYPDVTHPILATQDLAPSIGIGNAGMVLGLARAALGPQVQRVRVLAHHAHVGASAAGERARVQGAPARVLAGEHELAADCLFQGAPLALDRELNILSAAHALSIIEAMLPGAAVLETAAPGPLGLAGGWPVRISAGRISLDLPQQVSQAEASDFQQAAARADGIERIDADGTTHFTEQLRACVPSAWRHLAQPLHPDAALVRFRQLAQALAGQP